MERLDSGQWNTFKDDLEGFNHSMARVKLKFHLLDTTVDFAGRHGISFDSKLMGEWYKAITVLDTQARAINIAYSYIQSMNAGSRPSTDPADFDIVAKQGYLTSEQVDQATVNLNALNQGPFNLGIAPFVVAGGVAVVALVVGAIATVTIMSSKEKQIEAWIDNSELELEKLLIANPAILPLWTEYKESTQATTRGAIDDLFGTGTGKSILAGAGGLVLLLVGGYFVMKMLDKKNPESS